MSKRDGRINALVVGSGAGGAIVAAILAEGGWEVLVAEEGAWAPASERPLGFPEELVQMYRHGGLSPFLGRPPIAFAEGRGVGGSTEVNSGLWLRTPSAVVRRWQQEFQVRDISDEQLDKLFMELEHELKVSLFSGPVWPRTTEVLRQGAARLKWSVEHVPRVGVEPLRPGRMLPSSRAMSGSYIPRAVKAGARLIPNCRVVRIDVKGRSVNEVKALVYENGSDRAVLFSPDVVVVCGGAIQTPRLLRASGIRQGVGRTLSIHPMIKVAASFDEPFESPRTPISTCQIKEFWPEVSLGGSAFTPGLLALVLSENWEINRGIMGDWRRIALYYATCSGDGKGAVHNVPLIGEALPFYHLSVGDQRRLQSGILHLAELLFAAGARAMYPSIRGIPVWKSMEDCRKAFGSGFPVGALGLSAVHAFGTCPMGEDERRCAVDSYGKVHGLENLYVADASVIPDAPGVNPQATVMALALRTARHVMSAWGGQSDG